MGDVRNQENHHGQVQRRVLEALRKASRDLQSKPITFKIFNSQTAIKTISELDSKAKAIFSNDPTLFKLSRLVTNLKTQLEKLKNCQGYSVLSIIKRQLANYEIARIVSLIDREIQAWIDRRIVEDVVQNIGECEDEDAKIQALIEFEKRAAEDFDRDLQDMILRAKIFSMLETILCDSTNSMRIREQASLVIASLVRFNKDVFVGLVLMAPITQALVSMASCKSIQVLSSLVKLIKSPLIDELEANGEITKIIALLGSEDLTIRIFALDCLLEIAYYGRKAAIEAMLEQRLVEKLMELQRLENKVGDSTEMDRIEKKNNSFSDNCVESEAERREMEKWRPLERCVARFAVQVEVGEGLRQGEKREMKLEILKRIREASVSDAEAATIVAEVHLELLYCPTGTESSFTNPFNTKFTLTSLEKAALKSGDDESEAANKNKTVTEKKRDATVRGVLSVTMISAKDLPAVDFMGTADPFVVLKLKKSNTKLNKKPGW